MEDEFPIGSEYKFGASKVPCRILGRVYVGYIGDIRDIYIEQAEDRKYGQATKHTQTDIIIDLMIHMNE